MRLLEENGESQTKLLEEKGESHFFNGYVRNGPTSLTITCVPKWLARKTRHVSRPLTRRIEVIWVHHRLREEKHNQRPYVILPLESPKKTRQRYP